MQDKNSILNPFDLLPDKNCLRIAQSSILLKATTWFMGISKLKTNNYFAAHESDCGDISIP